MSPEAAASHATELWVTPGPDGFGAEIGGVDLARGLTAAEVQAVNAAFARHSVIWFRDQPLTHPQLEALSLQLGAFGQEPYAAPPFHQKPYLPSA
mgnify:CR=1 FL=1